MAIRWNESRLQQLRSSPSGAVGKHLARSGVRIESAAKVLATTERLVRTGRYRSSITHRVANSGGGLVLEIGSAVPYARYLEFGTEAHIIRARSKKALWWDMPNDRGWMVQPDSGRPVPYVNHPGNKAYMILHRSAASVMGGSITASIAAGG